MTVLCAAYILWTAWSVWRSGEEPARGGSGAFFGGIAMQFLNAGVILCAVTSFSVFILPHHDDARVIALFAFAIAAAGFVSACCWAAFGAALEKFFRAPPPAAQRRDGAFARMVRPLSAVGLTR